MVDKCTTYSCFINHGVKIFFNHNLISNRENPTPIISRLALLVIAFFGIL